jgi:hypothetical protein
MHYPVLTCLAAGAKFLLRDFLLTELLLRAQTVCAIYRFDRPEACE